MFGFRFKTLLAAGALLSALTLVAVDFADARPKGGMGSRGARTNVAPPPTATAPTTAAPINRTMTQPSAATRPTAGAPAAQGGGFFNRPGLLGGLAAGFLGAGLLGMLFGQGLFSNLGGLASILGFVAQLALIGGVAWLIVRWWNNRSQPANSRPQPAAAYADGPSQRRMDDVLQPRPNLNVQTGSSGGGLGGLGGGLGSLGGGLGGLGGARAAPQNPAEIEITPEDFNTFERLLGETLTAYGREDLSALRSLATPEMVSYFSEDLAENASRGVINQISDVKLLQGDLSESWREGDVDYATVAMRYELRDKKVDRATSRVVEGSDDLTEVTEVSTYRRSRGGNWMLSAIQEAQ